jgi:hypothetical protein
MSQTAVQRLLPLPTRQEPVYRRLWQDLSNVLRVLNAKRYQNLQPYLHSWFSVQDVVLMGITLHIAHI